MITRHHCTQELKLNIKETNGKRKIEGDTKKRELLKNPTKIEEVQEKKILSENEPLQLAF